MPRARLTRRPRNPLGGFRQQDDVMNSENPEPGVRIAAHPVLRILVSFPIACFCGALATDIVYTRTADMIWADFSAWLLAAAMFMSVPAVIVGFVDLLANRRVLSQRQVWPIVIGSVLVLVLGLFDNLVHSRDAWTSVVPAGLALSAVTVIALLITVWFGSVRLYRPVVAVQYSGARQ
jgi:uncharacterized membrane protein